MAGPVDNWISIGAEMHDAPMQRINMLLSAEGL
jgi:hypothetical protein